MFSRQDQETFLCEVYSLKEWDGVRLFCSIERVSRLRRVGAGRFNGCEKGGRWGIRELSGAGVILLCLLGWLYVGLRYCAVRYGAPRELGLLALDWGLGLHLSRGYPHACLGIVRDELGWDFDGSRFAARSLDGLGQDPAAWSKGPGHLRRLMAGFMYCSSQFAAFRRKVHGATTAGGWYVDDEL